MKKILVVVDMQNDFIDGPLGTDEAKKIVPKVAEKIRDWDGHIVYTMDEHLEDDPEFKLYSKHCVINTDGHDCNDEVLKALENKNMEDNPIFLLRKDTFGCDKIPFVDMYLSDDWKEENIDIEFVGLCTDLCVISNVLIYKAFDPTAHISVDASCCAGTTPEMHEAALMIMKGHGIDILNWEERKKPRETWKIYANFEPVGIIETPEDFCDLVRGK